MDTNNFIVKFITSIKQVSAAAWNSLNQSDYPFIRYEFLHALEASDCVCSHTGWQVQHLIIQHNHQLVAVMPLYIKTHSYGEYVFDFQWATAFHQSGLEYYPKLLTAIPFTPCSGPRMLIEPAYKHVLQLLIIKLVIEHAKKLKVSSWHLLFPLEKELDIPGSAEYEVLQRVATQYHWYNRDYRSFNDFLAGCKMKRRKDIKRERQSIRDSHIDMHIVEGEEIDDRLWDCFYHFYQRTYAKRSGNYGYLNRDFFARIAASMSSQIMMVKAVQHDQVVAIALFFKQRETLYGRYWGASAEFQLLHFEACYYQGIEYCIANGINHFDAGAQGEHKIQRGFEPIRVYSKHWIEHPQFRQAIRHFLDYESKQISPAIKKLGLKLPYKMNNSDR